MRTAWGWVRSPPDWGRCYALQWAPCSSPRASLSPGSTYRRCRLTYEGGRLRYISFRGQVGAHVGHQAPITCVSWDPSGQRLATGSYDGSALIWHVRDRAAGASLLNAPEMLARAGTVRHARLVNGVAFSPSGDLIATSSADHTIRITETDTGRAHRWFAGHNDDVNRTAWSADGRLLVSVSQDATARVWDVDAGITAPPVVAHGGHALGVDWNHQTGLIASCGEDSTLRLWSLEGARREVPLPGDAEDVKWSRDQTCAALACDDGYAYIVDCEGSMLFRLGPARAAVKAVAWSPDGKWLACGAYDGTVVVWDVEANERLLTLAGPRLWPRSTAWSKTGLLAIGTLDSYPAVVDVAAEITSAITTDACSASRHISVTRKLNGASTGEATVGINAVAPLPSGGGVAIAVDDGTVRVARIDDAGSFDECPTTIVGPPGTRSLINAVAASASGLFLFGTFNGTVGVTTTSGDEPQSVELATPINGLAWLDASTAAVALYDGRIGILHVERNQLEVVKFIQAHGGPIKSIAAHGDLIVAGATDNTISVHTADGDVVATLQGHSRIVNSVSVAPDNPDLIASASQDHTVRLWSIASGKCLAVLVGHDESVKAVAVGPGHRPDVLSGSYDFDGRIWRFEPESGLYSCVALLDAHTNGIGSVTWCGRVPVTSSWDGSCIAWKNPSGHDWQPSRGVIASELRL